MPDSAGEGFPGNVQVGHEHLHLSTGKIYQYLGGTPSVASSWVLARGIHAYGHFYSTKVQSPSTTDPTLVTFEAYSSISNLGWDGVGTFTIQIPGVYILSSNGQMAAAGALASQRKMSFWFRKNGIDIADSPVTNSISANVNDMRVVRNYRIDSFEVGDTIQLMMEIEIAGASQIGVYPQTVGTVTSPSAKVSFIWIPI